MKIEITDKDIQHAAKQLIHILDISKKVPGFISGSRAGLTIAIILWKKYNILQQKNINSYITKYGNNKVFNDTDIYIPAFKKPNVWGSASHFGDIEDNKPQLHNITGRYGSKAIIIIPKNKKERSVRIYPPTANKVMGNVQYIEHYVEIEDESMMWKYTADTKYKDTVTRGIIKNHDLNYAQIGVSLSNGKAIYTQEFVDFVETRELKIIVWDSYMESLLRAISKWKQLNNEIDMCGATVYFKDKEYTQLGLLLASTLSKPDGNSIIFDTRSMISIHKAKAKKYAKIIDKLYDEHKFVLSDTRMNSSGFYEEPEEDCKFMTPICANDKLNIRHIISYKPHEYILSFILEGTKPAKRFEIFAEAILPKLEMREETKLNVLETLRIAFHSPRFIRECTSSFRIISRFLLTCDKHEEMLRYINTDVGFDTTVQILLYINKTIDKDGLIAIGIFENLNVIVKENEYVDVVTELDKEYRKVTKTITNKRTNEIKLANPDGYKVKHLNNGAKLMEEGKEMHHCVGGYADAIIDGRSLIFSIKNGDPQKRLTVEVKKVESKYVPTSIFGMSNRRPSKNEKKMVENCVIYNLDTIKGSKLLHEPDMFDIMNNEY